MPNSTSGKGPALAGPDAPTLLEFAAPGSWLVALDPDAGARLPITLKTTVNAPLFAYIEKKSSQTESFLSGSESTA